MLNSSKFGVNLLTGQKISCSKTVTLKIGYGQPKPIQLSDSSQWYMHAILVKIHPLMYDYPAYNVHNISEWVNSSLAPHQQLVMSYGLKSHLKTVTSYWCVTDVIEITISAKVLRTPGPGCSKLTTSLVNVSLKFQTLISQICQYFLLKKCEKLLHCKSFSHFFNKKYHCNWLFSRETLNELTS